MQMHNFQRVPMKVELEIMILSGPKQNAQFQILELPIQMGILSFRANLIPIILQDFDIILGADWFSSYNRLSKEAIKSFRQLNYDFSKRNIYSERVRLSFP